MSAPRSAWLFATALLSLPAIAAPTPAAPQSHGDVRRGRSVFVAKSCARCHAIWGHGGDIGPDLGRTHAGALSDAELAAALWNHVPRMWGRMAEERIAHSPISEAEMADLFAYLSFVRAIDEPGDPAIGKRLLDERGCSTCHKLGEKGGGIGPDLRSWERYRNPAVWAKLMFDHAPGMTQAMRAQNMQKRAELNDRELVHIVAYIRSMSPTGDSELLDPGDNVAGERIFHDKGCVTCHSIRGVGGKVGPDFGHRDWATSFTGVAVKFWNHAEGMRAAQAKRGIKAPLLSPQEMANVIAFLFSASYADEPGSPEKGTAILKDKGCTNCHTGGVGPPLDVFRDRATPVLVGQALWKHGPTMLERMHDLEVRWPSFNGDEMRQIVAALRVYPPEANKPKPTAAKGDAP